MADTGPIQTTRPRHRPPQRRRTVLLGIVLTGFLWLPPPAASAQTPPLVVQDTVRENHSPRGALWRAAAVPGWGQVYNRQYVKLPFVYLGLGGVTALMLRTNNNYLLHRHAFLYKANEELVERGLLEENPWPQFEDEYRTLINQAADGREIGSEPIRARRDNLRRNRDLLIFGIGVWYGLSLLDAYVSAHLLDFDIGEDLSLRLHPLPHGVSATIRFAR